MSELQKYITQATWSTSSSWSFIHVQMKFFKVSVLNKELINSTNAACLSNFCFSAFVFLGFEGGGLLGCFPVRPHQFNFLVHGFFYKKYGARGQNKNKNKNCKMVGVKVMANPKHKEKKFSA